MAFLTWFGGAGFIVTRTIGWGPIAAVPLALLSGLSGGTIMFVLLARVLWPMRSKPMSSTEFRLPGTPARVVSSIREGGVGEIVYTKSGTRFTAGARAESNQPISKGTEVVIIRYERGLAYVAPIDDLLSRESAV
jgi:membrane protein implicated in regulation of membrane protease activity